ncbi:hypothetical protein [Acetobacter sp.]|jgi:hypothetical protein|uniref:hypothetical protein n=1 Tax=Acetobacter sp. TaxID=440 RepID=UPI0039EB65D3
MGQEDVIWSFSGLCLFAGVLPLCLRISPDTHRHTEMLGKKKKQSRSADFHGVQQTA